MLEDFYDVSATVGAFSRIEFGYPRGLPSEGDDPNYSPLGITDSKSCMAR